MCGPEAKCSGCGLSGGLHNVFCPTWLAYTAKLQKEGEDRLAKKKHLSDIAILNQNARGK